MSEDRHTFSEPRPIAGLALPSWDVDVFRDGVPEPILTLRVDETNLPPRRSKKKKIVWRLPETVEQVPRFGADEKRRLLDIFKNLKKERRKSKRGSETGASDTATAGGTASAGGAGDEEADTSCVNEPLGAATGVSNATAANTDIKEYTDYTTGTQINDDFGSPSNTQNGSSSPVQQERKETKSSATNGTTDTDGEAKMGMERLSVGQNDPSVSPAPPPGIPMSSSQSMPEARPSIPMPPPGLAPPSQQLPQQQQQQQQQQLRPAPGLGPATEASPLPIPPALIPPPPSRFVNMPPNMPHELFAQQVANLYISLLQTGQIEELLLYYAPRAQKSLSLKSAKSICATPLEMKTQLQSLVGGVFVVQGLTVQVQTPPSSPPQQQQQSQHAHQNDYILIIWSGICQLQGQQHGFCHTIILAPAIAGSVTLKDTARNGSLPRSYQIQNDALVLLANG